jgi:CBS domain containing-hemolysin-like protein
LGTHQGVTYRKAELKTFVALAVNGEERLSEEELKLIGSALEFAAKTVGDVMVRFRSAESSLMIDADRECLYHLS